MMRLADPVMLLIPAKADTPTLDLFGREVGHAAGCLRNWCEAAKLDAKSYRDFSRGARAVYRLQEDPSENDANLLDNEGYVLR
jgi:hypothetical protein